eukprot:GHVU01113778.1.p3 GENE.GHVU01113778.1~~GHVU01113778.1.p3  ORF type:complete len:127 (+),score=22.84 GHVU01113778.1:1875-2255(+)
MGRVWGPQVARHQPASQPAAIHSAPRQPAVVPASAAAAAAVVEAVVVAAAVVVVVGGGAAVTAAAAAEGGVDHSSGHDYPMDSPSSDPLGVSSAAAPGWVDIDLELFADDSPSFFLVALSRCSSFF